MSTKMMNSAEVITPDNVKESDVVKVTENVLRQSFSCSSVDTEVVIDGETGDELEFMIRGSYAVDVMGKDKSIAVECKGARQHRQGIGQALSYSYLGYDTFLSCFDVDDIVKDIALSSGIGIINVTSEDIRVIDESENREFQQNCNVSGVIERKINERLSKMREIHELARTQHKIRKEIKAKKKDLEAEEKRLQSLKSDINSVESDLSRTKQRSANLINELARLEREREDLVKYTVQREEADEMLKEAKEWETKYKTLKSEIEELPIVLPERIKYI